MILAILLTLVLAVFLSACGQSVADAKQQFCDSHNNLNTAVEKLQSVDANTSVDEAKQAKEEVAKAWDELAKSSKLLKNVQLKESEGAYKEITKAVDKAISGDSTLGDSAKTIATGAQKLDATLKVINTTVCGIK
jgi:predicted Holliday junction resolvase-like endonuclease